MSAEQPPSGISSAKRELRGCSVALGVALAACASFLIVLVIAGLAAATAQARAIECINHVKQLTIALRQYANDQRRFPAAAAWCDTIKEYVGAEKIYRCPVGDRKQRCHYAFNAKLSNLPSDKTGSPAQTILLFETDGGWNVTGGPELLLRNPRHRETFIVAFVDGSVARVTSSQLGGLQWEP